MSPALQLPVEFVEYEIAEQWRKWSSLWSPFHRPPNSFPLTANWTSGPYAHAADSEPLAGTIEADASSGHDY